MSNLIQTYLQEIQKQKQTNEQHEDQIQSLLKFNERLLYIIETEIAANRKDNGSLMPISQKSERESDLMNPINSLIKTRKTFAAKSQKGTKSVHENNSAYIARLQALGKNLQHSQFIRSQDHDESFLLSNQPKSHYHKNNADNDRKYSQLTQKVEKQLTNQLKNLASNSQKNKQFYDSKINELKNLSHKIDMYRPQQNFNQIAQKISMSPALAIMVKNAMIRGSKKAT